jgi:threonine/homoserine/homoserine lactone efflux protein
MPSMIGFLGIAAAIAIGAISPGPSFVLVSHIAISHSRQEASAAAIGMGLVASSSRCSPLSA